MGNGEKENSTSPAGIFMKWGRTGIYMSIFLIIPAGNTGKTGTCLDSCINDVPVGLEYFKDVEYAGGMFNGRYGFKKGRDGAAYCIEMDAAGGIEDGAWDGKAVPAASCPGCLVCVIGVGRFVRQEVRETADRKNQHKEITGVTKEELK